MAPVHRAYQIWDDETGNVIAKYSTRDEAISFLHAMFDANGAAGVSELAILSYPEDGSAPTTILEGAEFLIQYHVPG